MGPKCRAAANLVIAAPFEARCAPAPAPARSDLRTVAPVRALEPSAPDGSQSHPRASARAASRPPDAIVGSTRRPERAARRAVRFCSESECIRNAATHKTTGTPPSPPPLRLAARNRAAVLPTKGAPAANYQFVCLCGTQWFGIPLRPAPRRLNFFRGDSFCNAHFRAARARIVANFLRAGLDDLFRQHAKASFPRQALEGVLHQTIFDRVIAEDDHSSSGIQSGRGPRKKLPEFLLFSIHRSPQRQKRFCRGMQFLPSPCFSAPCHNRCQVLGTAYGTRPHDRSGDSS